MSSARPIADSRPEDRLLELIDDEVAPDRAPAVRAFARAYLRRLGGGDATEGIAPEALLGEILSLFEFACARDGEAIAVRAFNPTREEHGYEPVGSVLETNTDDLPFLVDSVSGELALARVARRRGCCTRSWRPSARAAGAYAAVRDPRGAVHRESVMHFDLDRRLSDDELGELEDAIRATLANVRAVVRDFPAMLERTNGLSKLARAGASRYEADEVEEVVDFLAWLQRGNFVYLGAREYDFSQQGISLVHGSGLGILADEAKSAFEKPGGVSFDELPPYVRRSRARRRPAAGRQVQRPGARAPARADGLHRRAPGRRERRDHRHVAPDRAVHDQGLRRARLRDAAAGAQAAPVRGGARADRRLARLQGRRRALRHLPEGRAVRRPGRRPAGRAALAARAGGHPAGAPARAPRRRRAQRLADPHAPARPLRRRAGRARARPVPAPLRHLQGRDPSRPRRQRALTGALPRPRARRAARAGPARARGRGHRALAHLGRRAARPARRAPGPDHRAAAGGGVAAPLPEPLQGLHVGRLGRARHRVLRPAGGRRGPRRLAAAARRTEPRCASTRRARRSSSRRRCRCSRTSGCA